MMGQRPSDCRANNVPLTSLDGGRVLRGESRAAAAGKEEFPNVQPAFPKLTGTTRNDSWISTVASARNAEVSVKRGVGKSVPSHGRIDLKRPAIDPPCEVPCLVETVGAKVVHCRHASDAVVTIDDHLFGAVELVETTRKRLERNQKPAQIHGRVLIRLTDIQQEDPLAPVSPTFEVVYADMEIDFNARHLAGGLPGRCHERRGGRVPSVGLRPINDGTAPKVFWSRGIRAPPGCPEDQPLPLMLSLSRSAWQLAF
jgi:hypothetical protein